MLNFDSHKSASRSAHVVHFTATFHSEKHLWKLPIPEYDPGRQLHVEITQVGASAATGAADQLATLLKGRGDRLTSTITRRELRKWLRASDEGKAVETAVTRLLAGDQ